MVSQSDSKDDLTREPPLRPVRMRLDPGNLQLGKYRILGEVGRGGMAEVFLAVAQGLSGFNKLVVLKIIRAEVAEDPDARSMFVDEARLAGRLNHPNVVHTLVSRSVPFCEGASGMKSRCPWPWGYGCLRRRFKDCITRIL